MVTKVGESHAWSSSGGLDRSGGGSIILTGSNVDYVGDIGNVDVGGSDHNLITLDQRRSQGGSSQSGNSNSSGTHCV